MSLTGISPTYPRPRDLREFLVGAGDSSQSNAERYILIIGNRTTAGSETVDTIDMTNPIQSDEDAINRCGRRSEAYWEYMLAVAADPAATYFLGCPAESGGTAASVTFTFATAATGTTDVEISFLGRKAYASVDTGDTAIAIAGKVADSINAADQGKWMCTAANGGTAIVTVTMSLKGPRFGLALGSGASVGMRMRFLKNVTTTVTKSALTAGTTEDDGTAVIAAAALGEFFYIVSPWHSTSALTATDNQTGELLTMVKTQNLPINGKEMTVMAGFLGTQAQSTTVATSSPANTVQGHLLWQENSDWLPGMLAAHWAGIKRSKQVAYPSANLNGYRSSDGQICLFPTAYQTADRPTETELVACLNNGVTALSYQANGTPFVDRDITMRSLNAQGSSDYKAREGHTFSALSFFWKTAQARWQSQKQPNVADDPVKGAKPIALVSTPSQLKALLSSVIDDLTSSTPLGVYPGPILDPSPASVARMKSSIVVTKSPGKLNAACDVFAVEHLIGTGTAISHVNADY